MGLSESHNLQWKTEKFQLLFFLLWNFSTTYVNDIRPKSFAQISFVFSKSKEKCYESKISISHKKSCFGCCIHQKDPTLVLLGQFDVSVSRNSLQLKFYSLLVTLLRNKAISEANVGHMKNRSCNFFSPNSLLE